MGNVGNDHVIFKRGNEKQFGEHVVWAKSSGKAFVTLHIAI
jgi:hypothetical protein